MSATSDQGGAFGALLTLGAARRDRICRQTLRRDVLAAVDATPVFAIVDARERGIHDREFLGVTRDMPKSNSS